MRSHTTATRTARIGKSLPVLAALLWLATSAGAMEKRDMGPVFQSGDVPVQGIRQPSRANAEKSADRIVRDMERKHKAKVVKEPEEREIDGRRVLVLRLLDDKKGKIKEVRVDAETGEEL